MKTYVDLANYIFPEINETIADLEAKYPNRKLPVGAEVTRFAPSPTGFLHLGSLFTSLVAHKVAKDTGGVFYLRLEDTDTKREVEGSGDELVRQLAYFGIDPKEGYLGHDVGDYGPYKQSERAYIYKVCIKELMKKGRAYPCFCSAEQLEETRQIQEAMKEIPGYYGDYAICRTNTPDEAIERIEAGEPYVIRFKSMGNHNNKITFHDEVRGDISIAENDMDIVILKSDGLPTYHFAHAVDDHFMHTTTVIRGEEWISSAPIHIELFDTLGFARPKYAHLPVIMKLDNGNKRKLSKRKDPEASVSHFIEEGFPKEALLVYLMSIANSNFEEWTAENHSYNLDEFKFSFDKMSLDGVLFDQDKLNFFSKEIIAQMSAEEVYKRVHEWATGVFKERLEAYKETSIAALNIERGGEKARKDYACYKDVYPILSLFYKEDNEKEFNEVGLSFNPNIPTLVIKEVLEDFKKSNDYSLGNDVWFSTVKELGARHKFAESGKIFKQNPDAYVGHVGDVAEIIRLAVTNRKNSPNLHDVLVILGKEEVDRRIDRALKSLH
jgi:glutamyl-tRNA synthetase